MGQDTTRVSPRHELRTVKTDSPCRSSILAAVGILPLRKSALIESRYLAKRLFSRLGKAPGT